MLFNLASSLLAAASLFQAVKGEDLPAIEVIGNKFFYSNNGSQFFMKGIAYQQDTANVTDGEGYKDPLADVESCKRDIPYLAAVDTNVIRVYALNASQDHTECMTELAKNGIYVIADLSEPGLSVNRDSPTWTVELYNRYTHVVDEFQNYTNVLGFFAGNEVTNDNTNTDASAYVKAAIRDTKAYIKDQGYRDIPVGYSSNDDEPTRVAIADYFACGDDDVKADFYGINMYEWCGESTFQKSGYADRTEEFANLSVPIFFSEYGCNEVSPREFTEVAALYSDEMTEVWSGGIVYMYFEEANNYGLVSISNGDVKTLEDYAHYSSEIKKVSPSAATASDASESATLLSCPTQFSDWKASTELPPIPNEGLCECMQESLGCVVSDDVDSEDYGDLFGTVCGLVSCDGISGNGTTGEYGAFSPCSSKQQLSFVLNLYYKENGSSARACDFDGSASTKSASTASSCASALSEAGSEGVGSVTQSLSASGSRSSGSSGSSGSGSGSSSSSSASSSSSGSGSSSGASSFKNGQIFTSIMALLVVGSFTAILV
ncbi:putative secreted protein [Wickerhamomyces ciferrii]|uniref:1,3-beta-glucanosyltransferase n=1 Tax=Wickerhamomyces ciferrii (strain ATCC 14091 / BCRC 22168 / CBS 111 / JCM 3599 / NBRC 0793 / NRRL Y-1031 F-60-10) TaxID=1206466 RepID=K0KLS0_WICCF|nr:uncharacterized protein BN7_5806 [Wickerhamomyces ciferrii]CCH46215.1 putative secreted protein [Wickerhamomyces ciferrii]